MARLDWVVSHGLSIKRRIAAELIREGRVRCEGRIVRNAGTQVFTPREKVELLHKNHEVQAVTSPPCRYVMLHKPQGVLSAAITKMQGRSIPQEQRRPSILDIIPEALKSGTARRLGVYGRLDVDTTGIMLLSTDGGIGQLLLHPSRKVAKLYKVGLVAREGRPLLVDDAASRFEQGVELASGERCLSATLRPGPIEPGRSVPLGIDTAGLSSLGEHSYLGGLGDDEILVAVAEGRYHQVKRMVAACGGHVASLHRVALGSLQLDDSLPPGEARELSETEIDTLHAMLPENRDPIVAPRRGGRLQTWYTPPEPV